MRLDKYLKVSRLIKRRTVANEACDNERVMVNGRVQRASYDVKPGDRIAIRFGQRTLEVEVLTVADNVGKAEASHTHIVVCMCMKGAFFMAYEITGAPLHHRLELDGRERLTVSGVEDVARFDETCIVMSTCVGELVVTGEGLHIGKLTLDGGELHVDGHIDSISYEEPAAGRTSLLSRLFG